VRATLSSMDKSHYYQATVYRKEQFSPKVFLVTLKLIDPQTISFKAGQFINVEVSGGAKRQYSIASTSSRSTTIDLLIDVGPGGPGSQYYSQLVVGDKVRFSGPMGRFGLAQDTGNIVFLAASTGIAPFKAMIESLLENQAANKDAGRRQMFLYMTFRFEEDIFWKEYFEQLEQTEPNFHFMLTLSKPTEVWKGCQGYVQSCIDKQLLTSDQTHFYICGGPKMVEGVLLFLRENHVPEERIHFEPF